MKFKEFSRSLQKIEETSSRNEMIKMLAELLKKFSIKEIKEAMYLLQGRVVPRFVSLEFNVAGKLMMKSLAKAFRLSVDELDSSFKKLGDLGLVGEKHSISSDSTLNILEVYKKLYNIAILEGTGSQEGKVNSIVDLIKSCDSISCKYVIRIILGHLRLGASDKSILDALSVVLVGDKSKRKLLDKAYGARSDIGFIAEEVLKNGVRILEKVRILSGTPVAAMLCERESSIEKIFKRLKRWIIQPKYDGLRAQVHFCRKGFNYSIPKRRNNKLFKDEDGNTKIISRNLEDLSKMFPDIKRAISTLDVESIILDGEAIGYDKKTRRYTSFQETIQRRRKYGIKNMVRNIPVRLFAFDLLYLNGKDLSEDCLEERLKILKKVLFKSKKQNVIKFTSSNKVNSKEDFEKVFKQSISNGLEGIVVKDPASKYYPGKRSFDWIKFKKSTGGYQIDEVDAVVLGYYRGRGARAKFGIGAILVGVLNKKNKVYESIAKVGTGIKDEEWAIIKTRLEGISCDKKPGNVEVAKMLNPDIWVKPEVVVVVEADEITRSTNHKAGVSKGRGFSLRFPRLKEFGRLDKTSEDITTVEEIKNLYKIQFIK